MSSVGEGRRRLMVRLGLPVTEGNVTGTTGLEDCGMMGASGAWKDQSDQRRTGIRLEHGTDEVWRTVGVSSQLFDSRRSLKFLLKMMQNCIAIPWKGRRGACSGSWFASS